MYVLLIFRVYEMDFTRGRIDQTHQGGVSVIWILLVLIRFWRWLSRRQVMMQESIRLIQPTCVNSALFLFIARFDFPTLDFHDYIRFILTGVPKLFSERLSNSITYPATRSWSWLRYVYSLLPASYYFHHLIYIGIFHGGTRTRPS